MEKTYQLPEELTYVEIASFKVDMYNLINEDSISITLDFSKCFFIDSTGLGAIISLFKRLNKQKGSLQLTNMNSNVRDLFTMTRLDQVIEIID